MSVRAPVFDNPVDSSKFPNRKLPFAFPATVYYPSGSEVQSLFSAYFGGLFGFAVIIYCLRALGSDATWLHPLLLNLAEINNIFLFVFVAHFSIVAVRGLSDLTALLCIAQAFSVFGSPPATKEYGLILMGLLYAWASIDLALHWVAINPLGKTPKPFDARYVIVSGVCLVYFAILQSAATVSQFVGITIPFAVVTFAFAIILNQSSGFQFGRLLLYGVVNYLFYPNVGSLAPGLQASTTCLRVLRPLPFLLFIFTSVAYWWFIQSNVSPIELLMVLGSSVALVASQICFISVAVAMPTKPAGETVGWNEAVDANQKSEARVNRDSIYLAKVAADGSPAQVDVSHLMQHAHFLGTTGSGKTSVGLIPLIEQITRRGDSSVIVLDLKGDSTELLAALDAARRQSPKIGGDEMPLRVFSMENGVRTFAFNTFLTKGWTDLSILERTDIICSSLGLDYGSGFGPDFFRGCNSSVIQAGNIINPHVMSMRQLFRDVDRLLRSKSSDLLLPEVRRSGTHAWFVLSRMAALDAINITAPTIETPDVLDHQIDLAQFFTRPQLAYFKLPSPTAAMMAPAIARLVANFLMVAGKKTERKHKVFLVIDEFQRMAVKSLDSLFQTARSLDIGLILANQSMTDLVEMDRGLASAVESNCHIRQWFSVKNASEIESLSQQFGKRDEIRSSYTENDNGTSRTWRVEEVLRASNTDINAISNDPHLSILQITGDRKGYGQYRGVPFVARSEFHISNDEYKKRRKYSWPTDMPGMITGSTTIIDTRDAPDPGERDRRDLPPDINSWQKEMFE
ncbi:MAG: type IV secretion system DNA-binding domain-containing protein [Pirellulaceae bacterium]|nr:type IV secretion system DNA-binding domain-containing protein [Pirellulaceae bacterium]